MLLAGCPKPATTPLDEGPASVPADESGGTQTGGIDTTGPGGGRALDDPGARQPGMGPDGRPEVRIIYFDYDKADIRGEYRTALADHARYLAANPGSRMRLEGHADERGSREYNIGLWERRAQAVRRVLTLQNVSPMQATTASFGEERPASLGHDEAAWAQNRRVEIVYVR